MQSSSGSVLTGNAQQTYSEYTFTANGLTYHYIGEWEVAFSGSLLSGTLSASGSYDRIEVTSGDQVVASYTGASTQVDFGSESSGVLGAVTNLLGLVGDLVGGEGTEAIENLHLDATPSLPATSFAGADVLTGGAGVDELFGFGGDDRISGGVGADKIDGGAGVNTLDYGTSASGVTIKLETGTGSRGDAQGDTFSNIQNVLGSAFDDKLLGNGASNELRSGAGNDELRGADGNDRLVGGAGDDFLLGGRGADVLFGQAGADLFVFATRLESAMGTAARDTIGDFSSAQGDKIDLTRLDGNDELTFIGTSRFTGAGNEVSFKEYENGVLVYADLDGDKVADFSIKVSGISQLSADDFLL